MDGLAVYVKEGLPSALGLSLENLSLEYCYLNFRRDLLQSVLLLYRSRSSSLFTAFDAISCYIDVVLSAAFVFEDFNVHHIDGLTYSGETDRPGEFCYNLFISNDLTQMVSFPTRILNCHSHSPALLDLFISSGPSFCSIVAFPPLGNSDHNVSVSIEFPLNSRGDVTFHCTE